jgi:hypothetical protein
LVAILFKPGSIEDGKISCRKECMMEILIDYDFAMQR